MTPTYYTGHFQFYSRP